MEQTRRIVGIDFYIGNIRQVVDRVQQGGLMVVPAGPGLGQDFVRVPVYRTALLTADTAITDSGFMLVVWRLRTGERLPKNSGLAFMREWASRPARPGTTVFWVMPSEEEKQRTQAWLRTLGREVDERHFYLAPFYGKGPYEDPELVKILEQVRPDEVMMGLGGGTQECLGWWLRENLTFRPAIYCVGAAIAFLTGGQADIPVWADKYTLGWLFRIMDNPKKFWRRYYEAFALFPLIWRYKDRLPPMRKS